MTSLDSLRVVLDGRSLAAPALRGWDRYTVGLVRELRARGVDVILVHRAKTPLNSRHVSGLGCDVVGLRDLGGLSWEQAVLPRFLARSGADLYHAPAEHGVPLLTGRPTVLTIHSVTDHSYLHLIRSGLLSGRLRDYVGHSRSPEDGGFANRYWLAQVRRADAIITPSTFCRDEVVNLLELPPNRVVDIPLAVDPLFHQPAKSPELLHAALDRLGVRRPYLLYVGGYEPHKNTTGLLDVFARVKVVQPDLALVMVGTKGVPDSLHRQTAELALAEGTDVMFLSNLGPELPDLYDGAQLFVTLSWRETFCLPVLEALSRGVEVVASAWGGVPEVVGDTGSLVDPRDHDRAVQSILERLFHSGNEASATRARQMARRFTWDELGRRTLSVYQAVVSEHE